jgi:type IV secretion system protein TrbB
VTSAFGQNAKLSKNAKLAERLALRWREDTPDFILKVLDDPETSDCMVNPDGEVLSETIHGKITRIGQLSPQKAEGLANLIASLMNASISAESPKLDGELPGYLARVSIVASPVSQSPVITIRKHARAIYTLDDYVNSDMLTHAQRDTLLEWVEKRLNIIVVGGTGSGKTTFLNALSLAISQINPEHRLLILEDTSELQCKGDNVVQMRSCDEMSLQELVKAILRHRPDRIIVGEVRGKEAFDLLNAWSTGHAGGLASLHANSAQGTFIRLEQLLEMAVGSPARGLIAEAIDGIVYIEKTPHGRKIKELLRVHSWDGVQYKTETV